MESTARKNFEERLKNNSYPGRGIVIGKNDKGQWIQIYWIMGRSENSRNRVFAVEDGILKTRPADPSKVKDPSLIIYNAMRESRKIFIVSNGSQTDVIHAGIESGTGFVSSLMGQKHEPDAPNFTPRISGCIEWEKSAPRIWLSIVRASPFDSNESEHHFFHYANMPAGFGRAVTTYKSDGNPIPSFEGAPFLAPLAGTPDSIAKKYWEALDGQNRISLAVRHIDNAGMAGIIVINKYA